MKPPSHRRSGPAGCAARRWMCSSTNRCRPTARCGRGTTSSSPPTSPGSTPTTGRPRPRCSRTTCGGSSPDSAWPIWSTSRLAIEARGSTGTCGPVSTDGIAVMEPAPELTTLADLPFHVLGRHPKPLLIGQCRQGVITGESTRDWFDRVRDLALGLMSFGVGKGDRVVIMSESRPEWLLTDFAILTAGAVTVPVYSTLTPGQARYIIQDAGARVAFVSTADQLEKLQRIRHELPSLEVIIEFDPPVTPSISVLSLQAVAGRGHARMMAEWGVAREFRDRAREIRPDDLATIIYTSGTTGEPKGVMLSHHNLVSNLLAGHTIVPVGPDDVSLSFLPLSHAFERLVSYVYLAHGVTVIFAESMDTVGRDLVVVRPTVMTGVPRVYEKFQARIMERGHALSQPRRTLFHWGVKVAVAKARAEASGARARGVLALEAALADRLVFSTIRERVRGRLRCLVSGSAPLPPT